MDDNLFWNKIWKYLTIIGCVFICSISSCCIHKDRMLSDVIENGADPIEAGIAFSSQKSASQTIAAILNKNK